MRDQENRCLSDESGKKTGGGHTRLTLLAALMLLGFSFPGANVLARTAIVNCPGDSIQALLNLPPPAIENSTIIINGTCDENVSVTLDNVRFVGGAAGIINGTVTVTGARRIIFNNLTITGPGDGITGDFNAAFRVTNSTVTLNGENGITLINGAHGEISGSTISNNGQAGLRFDQGGVGVGVLVDDHASAVIKQNQILDNRSDGVAVGGGAFARVEENTIKRNGRVPLGEGGVDVYRARVRANGNVYADNPYAAIVVGNFGEYRTGSLLNAEDTQDSPFPFEQINKGTGQYAVDLYQMGFADLRQVNITGTVWVGHHSMLQLRGDNVGANTPCSTIIGDVEVYGTFAVARFRHTNVTGMINLAPDARQLGASVCS